MGMWGYLHRVSAERLEELLAERKGIIGALYPRAGEVGLPGCTAEKAWNAIEFVLDRLAQEKRIPRISALAGGEETGIEFDNGPCWYRTPAEVKDIARVLGTISKEEFRKGYLPEAMVKAGVYPGIWERPEREENFDYVWGWFEKVAAFYGEAAVRGEGMLLHLA